MKKGPELSRQFPLILPALAKVAFSEGQDAIDAFCRLLVAMNTPGLNSYGAHWSPWDNTFSEPFLNKEATHYLDGALEQFSSAEGSNCDHFWERLPSTLHLRAVLFIVSE
jgi:hypothetical protein